MAAELGSSQLSSLLEAVPGLASVLRSSVADAIVNLIRAGAGLDKFRIEDAQELVQYATRRSLINDSEGSDLMDEIAAAVGRRPRRKSEKPRKKKTVKKAKVVAQAYKKKAAYQQVKRTKSTKSTKKKSAKNVSKATKKTAKSTAKKTAKKKR